ncbi:hypothetical protein IMCC20628_02708 [Hoeflea sp. IMCC20628]|uniref:hypothetical protein n=1 Tax=Hoeflea sp. IMCC20628 TaxID=1620421 RepID=UPI00063BDF13|nr:hypothetical protein [Hoeflea sp. IMCC20628]AKI01404.1 hypothetical protein IMCC20628_02708 [Hoeflea sp. IMCC20628]
MIGTRRVISSSGLVRMLCALSLLLVAFAHKPLISSAAASAYAGVNVADYVLPDGTLPDLCLDGEGTGKHGVASPCEACRIVSSVDLPSPLDVFVINRRIAPAEPVRARNIGFTPPVLQSSASPRGPPSSQA